QQAIAKSGYDTQDFTADDAAYNKLHACCQYDRKVSATSTEKKACCDKADCSKKTGKSNGASCCKDKDCCKS
ncbi:MAG TPA: hypothetical protein VKH37_05265, partial [Ferruginibacter sp.]|nr:hypothetical protein [Ferruginibacter sp.]